MIESEKFFEKSAKFLISYIGDDKTGKPIDEYNKKRYCTLQKLANSFGITKCKLIKTTGEKLDERKIKEGEALWAVSYDVKIENAQIVSDHFQGRMGIRKEKAEFKSVLFFPMGNECPIGWCNNVQE